MPRRLMLVMVWLGGTACAALLATFSVSLIGARITNPEIKPLSRERIEQELASSSEESSSRRDGQPPSTEPEDAAPPTSSPGGQAADRPDEPESSPTTAAPTGTGVPLSTSVPTDNTAGSREGPSSPSPTSTAPSSSRRSSSDGSGSGNASESSTGSDSTGSGSSGGSGSNSGRGGPAPTTTAPPLPISRTFRVNGGEINATCTGASIAATATPSSGWSLDDSNKYSGTEIDIRFEELRPGRGETRVRANCVGGVPTQHA